MQNEHQVIEGNDEVELVRDGVEQRRDARVARDGSRHTQKRFIPREGIEAERLRQIDEHADPYEHYHR